MAKIVLGIGTSHSPMLSMAKEQWGPYAQVDKLSREGGFVTPPDGQVMLYEELEKFRRSQPIVATIDKMCRDEVFFDQWERAQVAIATLGKTLRDAKPDAVIIVSDDQDELLFEDVMPSLGLYWGKTMRIVPRLETPGMPEAIRSALWGYGDVEMDVPVDHELGAHLIHFLIEHDFDIAHSRYMKEETGGTIGPAGYVKNERVTAPKRMGMPHGWAFVVRRLMDNNPFPILPIFQNTCYPPNQPTPKRCYTLGQTIREAVEAWDSNKRVAIIGSGGLSHFVTDEEIDNIALDAMKNKDAETLKNLPRHRVDSAASEIRNWVTTAGATEHLDFELLDYLPVYRTLAGTGGGWAFGRWQ
ncbi:MAG: OH-DDVA oxygenase/3-O-methylgallate 3,4-dioxygenase [Chloroflexi bacterium]|jgi:aromatic ring-opening dioxygenase catalytic subunit (LigB family)|nr:MAG: OH-DDVA oxygenase/3-O-methylgallate 3,4-dioxygenase [Chloroflexota bacterium]